MERSGVDDTIAASVPPVRRWKGMLHWNPRLLALLALFSVAAGLGIAEMTYRVRSYFRARRCWKEIEDARRDLILDEHVVGRRRLGLSSDRESVAGRRAS
jgi:hypothetical protein